MVAMHKLKAQERMCVGGKMCLLITKSNRNALNQRLLLHLCLQVLRVKACNCYTLKYDWGCVYWQSCMVC